MRFKSGTATSDQVETDADLEQRERLSTHRATLWVASAKYDEAVAEAARLQHELDAARATVRELREIRDEFIQEAREGGMTGPAVAAASGLHLSYINRVMRARRDRQ